jgi:hypothetical protein
MRKTQRRTNRNYIPVEQLEKFVYSKLKEMGYLNETKIRNNLIRAEFEQIIATKMYIIDALIILSEKYYLSIETIKGIIYKKQLP